ncbi:MAG: hypothetical protein JWQ04_1123, partial [Pedosphaera sp.]|nr:hypothetical protein [Pedosphaera sp.]
VYEQCVLHGHFEVIEGREAWVCWRGLNGDDRRTFRYVKEDGQKVDLFFSWPPSYGDPASGKAARGLLCEYSHWSNPSIKDIAVKIRDGRGAKCSVPNEFADVWTAHMFSERRIKVLDKYNHETYKFEKIGKRPNHIWDDFCMQLALACMAGIFGDAVPVT